jgi:hypothetical protein
MDSDYLGDDGVSCIADWGCWTETITPTVYGEHKTAALFVLMAPGLGWYRPANVGSFLSLVVLTYFASSADSVQIWITALLLAPWAVASPPHS